jgi:hypothetical protein
MSDQLCRIGIGRWLAVVLGVLLASAGAARPAAAHGGTVRVDGEYGAYHIIAATGPGTQAGDLVLTVVLSTPDTGGDASIQPVLGATVTATFTLTGTQAAAPAPALVIVPLPTEPTLGEFGYYEHIFPSPGDGTWLVTVQVSGQDGTGEARFPLTLQRPPAVLENQWVQWGVLIVPILIALGVLAYVWRGRGTPPPAGR